VVSLNDTLHKISINDVTISVFGKFILNSMADCFFRGLGHRVEKHFDGNSASLFFVSVFQVESVEVREHSVQHFGDHGIVFPLLNEGLKDMSAL
jgi:hypothetical protein